MKIVTWTLAVLLILAVAFVALERAAAERIEVIELTTLDDSGAPQTTRLWIVDHNGSQYLRSGTGAAGWYKRLSETSRVTVKRGGQSADYLAISRPELRDIINQLMRDKYTWGDQFISVVIGGRDNAMPVELRPTSTTDR